MTDLATSATDRLEAANRACAALRAATDGRDADRETVTTAGSLAGLLSVIDGLRSSFEAERARNRRLTRALERVARLDVRGRADKLEERAWKRLVDDLQSIADGALTIDSIS